MMKSSPLSLGLKHVKFPPRLRGAIAWFRGALAGRPCVARMQHVLERLGYSAGTKLLIIHADDLGMAYSINRASLLALEQGFVSSASLMIPCPWLSEVVKYVRSHPQADIGVHLTLSSEWNCYRWGPVAARERVRSLLDEDGYFHADMSSASRHAKPEEVELELRAQIDRALELNIQPTHLDSHMGVLFTRLELYAVLIKVAHDYGIPFLSSLWKPSARMMSMLTEQDFYVQQVGPDDGVPLDQLTAAYVKAIEELKPGLHEMIVHPGYDGPELKAITAGHLHMNSHRRQRDFDAISGPEFQRALEINQVTLLRWRDLKNLVYPAQA